MLSIQLLNLRDTGQECMLQHGLGACLVGGPCFVLVRLCALGGAHLQLLATDAGSLLWAQEAPTHTGTHTHRLLLSGQVLSEMCMPGVRMKTRGLSGWSSAEALQRLQRHKDMHMGEGCSGRPVLGRARAAAVC